MSFFLFLTHLLNGDSIKRDIKYFGFSFYSKNTKRNRFIYFRIIIKYLSIVESRFFDEIQVYFFQEQCGRGLMADY